MNARAHCVRQRFHQRQHRTRIRAEVRVQIQFAARQQNRDAVIADGTRKKNLVARPNRGGRNAQPRNQMADPRSRDVHLIGLAVLDDFGIAARDHDTGGFRGSRHGAHFRFENVGRQSGFQHVTDDQRLRPRSRNRQVIHGSVHRQLADGTAGKAQRPDHETVGGHRDARAVDVDVSGVAQRRGNRSEKKRREQPVDQPAARLAAGAMSHLDLRIAEADFRRCGGRSHHAPNAAGIVDNFVSTGVLRCS